MLQPFWQDHQWLMNVILISVAVAYLFMCVGCSYSLEDGIIVYRDYGHGDKGWFSLAHDPHNDPYYWNQISHTVGDKLK